jgi:hypothetical protein
MQGYDAGIDYLYCAAPVGEPFGKYGSRHDCGHRIALPAGVELDWGFSHQAAPGCGWTRVPEGE